jgi:hypothetical protein
MRFLFFTVAVAAASLALWDGHLSLRTHARVGWPQLATIAAVRPMGQPVESGTPMWVHIGHGDWREMIPGGTWEGWTAGDVVMLRADAPGGGAPDASPQAASLRHVVLDQILIPARTHLTGVVTGVAHVPGKSQSVLKLTVLGLDSQGRSIAMNATAGPSTPDGDAVLRLTVREIVTLQ